MPAMFFLTLTCNSSPGKSGPESNINKVVTTFTECPDLDSHH